MSTEPDNAVLDGVDDCCASKRCNSISTPVQNKAGGSCKSARGDGPVDPVTDTCCAGDGEGNSPVAQESGCSRSSCATEAFKQTKDQLCGSMAGDKCCGKVTKSDDTAVGDKPDSCCPSPPEGRNGERTIDDGNCCDGMITP